jgi:hypothetical protein
MATIREVFWEGGWVAFLILPWFWGALITYPLVGVALLFGTVLRTILVAMDPESRFIKSTARQIATGGDFFLDFPDAAQPPSGSVTTVDQAVTIEPKEQTAVSEGTCEPT